MKRHSVLGVRRWHGLQTTGARPEFIALLQVVSAVAVQLPSSIELERATVSETVGGLAAAGRHVNRPLAYADEVARLHSLSGLEYPTTSRFGEELEPVGNAS